MKRSLLILVATAAVWTGCSKTETIDQPQGMAIGFTNAYIGNPVESKAVGIINRENITEFLVYGGYNDMTHVFNGVSVTGSAATDEWSYTTTRYWVAGKTYKFAAYAPSGIKGTVEPDFATGTLDFTNYVSDPSNQKDLIYATAEELTPDPIDAPQDKVQFGFSHLLSMIKFTFNSGFGNDITVTVDNLNVSGMISQGSYTGSTGLGLSVPKLYPQELRLPKWIPIIIKPLTRQEAIHQLRATISPLFRRKSVLVPL